MNELHDPRVVCNKLPQESILSPILFIYTRPSCLFGNNIKIIQFADDFCFYIFHSDYKEFIRELEIVYTENTGKVAVQNGIFDVNEEICVHVFYQTPSANKNTPKYSSFTNSLCHAI